MNRSINASAERIRRIEAGLLSVQVSPDQPAQQLDLQKLMGLYKVPGMSIAVIDDFEIAGVKGYGVTEQGTSTPVTPRTIFQAGSLSKPVTATGALFLVQQGKLSLDENINHQLKSWQVPENEFTQEQKVTLRRILSHTAGLTVHGFPGYDINEAVPTPTQLLNGEPPANTEPVRVDLVPGTQWRYSGGGTVIAQQLMEDVSGTPFPQLMREILFKKLGMDESTFEQPLPPERHALAASGTRWDGTTVHGKWHVYPEMAAGGLWSTASDLSRLLIEIALSKIGKANHILSQDMAQEMLRPQTDSATQFLFGKKENPSRMGLGFFLGDETRPHLFGHSGDDAGFQAIMLMDSDTGQGAVVMTNSELGGLVAEDLIDAIAREYGWKDYVPASRPHAGISAVLAEVNRLRDLPAAFTHYQTLKKSEDPRYLPDENTLVILGYLLLANEKSLDALEALKLEVLEYPEYWNGYDTLAEIYMALGEDQPAIQNYNKSIELNPDNQNAIEILKKLNGQS